MALFFFFFCRGDIESQNYWFSCFTNTSEALNLTLSKQGQPFYICHWSHVVSEHFTQAGSLFLAFVAWLGFEFEPKAERRLWAIELQISKTYIRVLQDFVILILSFEPIPNIITSSFLFFNWTDTNMQIYASSRNIHTWKSTLTRSKKTQFNELIFCVLFQKVYIYEYMCMLSLLLWNFILLWNKYKIKLIFYWSIVL